MEVRCQESNRGKGKGDIVNNQAEQAAAEDGPLMPLRRTMPLDDPASERVVRRAEGAAVADESDDDASPTPKVILAFAGAVRRQAWEEVYSLLSADLQARLSVESVASVFDWDRVATRFRAASDAGAGLHAAQPPAVGPPTCCEIFGVEADERPVGLGLPDSVGWSEIHFENDFLDVCYVCFLAAWQERIVYYSVRPPNGEMADEAEPDA